MSRGYLEGYSTYEYRQARSAENHWWKQANSYEKKWKHLRKHFRDMVKNGAIEVDDETAKLIGLRR